MEFLPLNAMRVFAAVGRHLSFSQAAAELHVTASAVSHQIRSLEDHLGLSLLRRDHGKITLTKEGRAYLQEVSDSMTRLARATMVLKAAKNQRMLRISAGPSLAALWLVPRIHRFAEAHPDLSLSISADHGFVDLSSGQYDVAFRHSLLPPEGVFHVKLSINELFPVCSPKLLKGRHPLRTPSDLRYHTLLDTYDDARYDIAAPGWEGWFQAAGLEEMTRVRSMNLSPRNLMNRVMLNGLGVGLSRTLLAADFIASGELVCPFGPVITMSKAHYFVCQQSIANKPEVVAFRKWVLAEAEKSVKQVKLPR